MEEDQAKELQAEQEERDHALALRLAHDSGSQVDDISPLKRYLKLIFPRWQF